MSSQLLREFIEEAMLAELRIDHDFLNRVHRVTGIRLPGHKLDTSNVDATHVALEWLADVEHEIGRRLWPSKRAEVIRYVAQRMPALVTKFHGDISAAERTMYNLLNVKFTALKPSSR